MKRTLGICVIVGMAVLSACGKKESTDAQKSATETPEATQAATGPHASVHLKDGTLVPGTVVASTQTDMVVRGDDGIERKIPLDRIQSVEYGTAQKPAPARRAARERQRAQGQTPSDQQASAEPAAPVPPPVTTKTYVLPAGSQLSVRTNDSIDSATATEGQTFDAQVTRDATDANGDVVIPRGSSARVMIKSASKGGRFRGSSDLVLDLQSVVINGQSYLIDAADVSQKGKSGIGANKRTATYTGGGAALGAIIGAIAGGGKGAAIGAGAGAGAGALGQVITKGGSIKVPAESVLTFSLDKPLHVTAAQ